MDKRKIIFLIVGIIIIGIVSGGIIFYSIVSNRLNIPTSQQITIYLEGKEDYGISARGYSLGWNQGDTVIFSFNTEPNGLIEVEIFWGLNNHFDLFIAANITNYELVIPGDSCSLRFSNLELFDIMISLSYTIN